MAEIDQFDHLSGLILNEINEFQQMFPLTDDLAGTEAKDNEESSKRDENQKIEKHSSGEVAGNSSKAQSSDLTCDECHKVCKNQSLLTKHKISHSNLRPYVCELCSKTYKYKFDLKKHKKLCSGSAKQTPHSSTVKNKNIAKQKFSSTKIVQETIKTKIVSSDADQKIVKHSSGEVAKVFSKAQKSNFTCDECHKVFKNKASLTLHQISHSNLRPHVCELCSKSYKYKKNLTEHKKSCSGSAMQISPSSTVKNQNIVKQKPSSTKIVRKIHIEIDKTNRNPEPVLKSATRTIHIEIDRTNRDPVWKSVPRK